MDVERAVERRKAVEQRIAQGESERLVPHGWTKECPRHGQYIDTGRGICPVCEGKQHRYRPMRLGNYLQEIEAALRQRPENGPVCL